VYGSYHYLIGSNGEIEPLVPDSLIAYHTPQVNRTSIGIGVMHVSNGLTGYNEKQIAALEILLARLSKKYTIAAKDINGKNHYNQRKRCDFDLVKAKIMAAVQEKNL
ncbi:MAG: N-acetylmuramoyl-L-alanine amidase, partial [Hymenobacter sp.]|nr:N-acetylmuramoyl-L-alanine amidase [Hymenobacter sp.]